MRTMGPVAMLRHRWLLAFGGVVAIVVALIAVGTGSSYLARLVKYHRWLREREATATLLHSVRYTPPPGMSQGHWENGPWMVVYNGFGNACSSPEGFSRTELRRFREDVEVMIRQRPPSCELMADIWQRLSQCSPAAEAYVRRFTPLFDEAIAVCAPNP